MTPVSELPPMLTLAEAGPHLRCSRWTLARAAERGELRVVRLGRRILVPRTELERMLGLTHSEGPASTAEPLATTDTTAAKAGGRRDRD